MVWTHNRYIVWTWFVFLPQFSTFVRVVSNPANCSVLKVNESLSCRVPEAFRLRYRQALKRLQGKQLGMVVKQADPPKQGQCRCLYEGSSATLHRALKKTRVLTKNSICVIWTWHTVIGTTKCCSLQKTLVKKKRNKSGKNYGLKLFVSASNWLNLRPRRDAFCRVLDREDNLHLQKKKNQTNKQTDNQYQNHFRYCTLSKPLQHHSHIV